MPTCRRAKSASFHRLPGIRAGSRAGRGNAIPDAILAERSPTGNLRPVAGLLFPQRFAALFELQSAAVGHAGVRIDEPNGAPENTAYQRPGAICRHELKVDFRSRPQRLCGLHECAPRAEIDDPHLAPRTQRRPCDDRVRPVETWIGAAIRQRLIHAFTPASNRNTRVRPVPPNTRTAYCARLPRT